MNLENKRFHNINKIFINYEVPICKLIHLLERYQEPHRVHHNLDHILDQFDTINKSGFNSHTKNLLLIASAYHDAIYKLDSTTNEIDSANLFKEDFKSSSMDTKDIDCIYWIIRDTSFRDPAFIDSNISLSFWYMDNSILDETNFEKLLDYENKIFNEYKSFPYNLYVEKRTNFLMNEFNRTENDGLLNLSSYVSNRKIKIGIYAGSFNPFTIGHLNILNKAKKIFDKVILVKGKNASKSNENEYLLPTIPGVEIIIHNGLMTDLLKDISTYSNVTLIRGLRNGKDLDYEVNTLRFMESMMPEIQVIYINCDKEFEHVSSSAIRDLLKISPEHAKKYIV